MKYDAVVFDLDGTILSTLDDLADSLNYALRKNGLPERTKDQVRQFVGNGIRKLMERGVPAGSAVETVDRVHADFTCCYREHNADKTKPYDDVLDVMRALREKGLKLAVVSNKADYAVKALCERFFPELLDEAAGEIEGVPRKPAPDGVFAVVERMGVLPERCVYVGDSDVDVLTARNSGMDCIAVDWGFRSRESLERAGADVIASTPWELADKILQE